MPISIKAIIALVCAVVIGVAIYGAYQFPQVQVLAGSPTGSTFSTAKFAGTVIDTTTTGNNATSTSILNSDAGTRYVTGFRIGCSGVGTSRTAYTGAGLANWQISIGTTSAAAPASFTSFAAVVLNFTLGTSTTGLLVASSTLQTATSSLAGLWPSNTNMTFFLNATNTAACTVGVDYVGS